MEVLKPNQFACEIDTRFVKGTAVVTIDVTNRFNMKVVLDGHDITSDMPAIVKAVVSKQAAQHIKSKRNWAITVLNSFEYADGYIRSYPEKSDYDFALQVLDL